MYPSMHWAGRVSGQEGVWPGGCLARGGVLSAGGVWPGGSAGGCLPGGVCQGGVCLDGCGRHHPPRPEADTPTPCEILTGNKQKNQRKNDMNEKIRFHFRFLSV